MKNSILLLPLLIATFFLINCNTLKGHRGINENIEEAKKREVFICEYELTNTFQADNQVPLSIEEIWMEHKWNYPSNLKKADIQAGYRLIVKLTEESFKGYGKTWIMCIEEKGIVPAIRGVTHFSQNTMFPDSIKINIHELKKETYKMSKNEPLNEGKKLGSFVLIQK